MMRLILIGMFAILAGVCRAQEYQIYSPKKDSFSLALVQLLKCAQQRFIPCQGDSIRSTWLMGDDYRLAFSFPGSSMAIVRRRDYDVNAYIEFRGYSDEVSREAGIREIAARIKNTFGERLRDNNTDTTKKRYFYGLSLQDENGFFSMNMEMFGSSSTEPVYLLGPEKEREGGEKKHFILLKIYPGTPQYYHFIRPVKAQDQHLDNTLRSLLALASRDFDSIQRYRDSLHTKIKKRDTLSMNGIKVYMDYGRGAYSAVLNFPAASDSTEFSRQWSYYQQAIQSALGTAYYYYEYTLLDKPFITYFGSNENFKHRLRLETIKSGERTYIQLIIPSLVYRPVKAGLDAEDFE